MKHYQKQIEKPLCIISKQNLLYKYYRLYGQERRYFEIIYKNEISEHPFPRSIKSVKALATLRGSRSGSLYSEKLLEVVKMIH